MINIYDGNNVMFREAMRPYMPGQQRMTLRMRFERAGPNDIWVWDGKDHNERRQAIYPKYKTNRTPKPMDVSAQIQLWKKVLRHTASTQIEVYGWEADDCIGTLVRKLGGRTPVTVHTNDQDYGQVAHLCKLNGVDLKGVPPEWVCLYKAMRGDSSDAIDGIPGFGPKRWTEVEPHWPAIRDAIVAGDPAAFDGIPFKPAVRAWLAVQENVDQLQAMFIVTHFENVPDDELEGGMIQGVPNLTKGHEILTEFFL